MKPAPLHWCHGCCGSRAQAVEKMFLLTSQVVVGHILGTSAENKWGSVLPACQDVVLLSGFYCLLPVVEHAMNGRRLPGVVKGGPLPADYGIAENFEQTRRARQMRVAKFIHSPTSKARLLTYLLLVKSPVRLHFRLFRDAFGTRPCGECHGADMAAGPVFDLANMERTPVLSILSDLMSLACSWEAWSLVLTALPLASWDDVHWWTTRCACFSLFGEFYLRLYAIWDVYPFKLAAGFDPRLPKDERRQHLHEFVRSSECCLDRGCSAKLRRLFPTVKELMTRQVQEFMVAFFNALCMSTASVECGFSRIRSWVALSPRPMTLAYVNAKWIVNELQC